MSETIKTYKGTNKGMKCRGMQYALGETVTSNGAIRCGDRGFHSCEAPFDVLRYYPLRNGNRYFEAEVGGEIDRAVEDDTKIASSELTLKAELGLPALIKAQISYTRKKAESGASGGNGSNLAGGYGSNLAGGNDSNLAGGDRSNLAGGDRSNLAGGYGSNLAGGDGSNLAGGDRSNLAGGYGSNLAGGYHSNLAGGNDSNLAGGNGSNLAGGNGSNLAGGDSSIVIGRTGSRAKGGKNSVLVLTEWKYRGGGYVPACIKVEVVDGERIKADTWYTLKGGELMETTE